MSPDQETVARHTLLHVALFGPTLPNPVVRREPAPEDMAWIPGGEFSIGAQDPPDMVGMKATEDARPIHRVYADGFHID